MNPRLPIIVVLCAAIAAGAYFFFGRETWVSTVILTVPASKLASGNAQAAGVAGENFAAGTSSDAAKKPALDWKRIAAMAKFLESGGGDAPSFPEVTEEDIARFLAKHGETPANLVAASEALHDPSLVYRALELFPNSPLVLLAVMQRRGGPWLEPGEFSAVDPERMALIERFKAADPNNPLPWIFSAAALFTSGQTADGVAAIRAALERPAFYSYFPERCAATQRLYEDIGLHPLEASLLAMAGQTIPHMAATQQASRRLMDWQKAATESGDTAGAADATRLTYALGRTFATPEASRWIIDQHVGIAIEKRALEALPADAQPDWLTVTPAQRLAEMEKQKQAMIDVTPEASDFAWIISSQNEQVLAEGLRRLRSDGEFSALTWLKAQRK